MTAALLVADATDPARRPTACCRRSRGRALDCPSYVPALWDADVPSLLARMQAELLEPIPIGEPIVATGWLLERGGPQALHRVRAAERRRAAARPRAGTCGCMPRARRELIERSAARPLVGVGVDRHPLAGADDVEQPRDVARRRADDREAAAVGADLRRGAEQRTQAGGVAEVDVGEVDEQARAARRRGSRRAARTARAPSRCRARRPRR